MSYCIRNPNGEKPWRISFDVYEYIEKDGRDKIMNKYLKKSNVLFNKKLIFQMLIITAP